MTEVLALAGSVSAILAGLSAFFTLPIIALQVRKSSQIAQAQFLIDIEVANRVFHDLEVKLRPGGDWAAPGGGPVNESDWAEVDNYAGFFETCEVMISSGLIDEKVFLDLFAYKIECLMANDPIRNAITIEEPEFWAHFIRLHKRVENFDRRR